MVLVFKNGVKSIKTTGYNVARTVYILIYKRIVYLALKGEKCVSLNINVEKVTKKVFTACKICIRSLQDLQRDLISKSITSSMITVVEFGAKQATRS